jgi:hypothetical protein
MMNAKAVIRIGRKRSRAASSAASSALALLVLHLRELDDQDGVLGREADQHDEADLHVDVVVEPEQPDAEEGAEGDHGVPSSTAHGSDQLS